MSGQSGKGNSSAETTNNVSNQQVAAQSGIAFGAGSKDNAVSISTADPEVAKAAIFGNVAAGANALSFAGHAAEVAAQTNMFAQKTVENIAGTSILSGANLAAHSISAQNELATKFGENTSEMAAQNVGLLQSVGQELTTVSLAALNNNKSALDSAFGVAAQAAPQTDNYTATALATTTSRTFLYILAAVAAIFGFFFFTRKKA